MTAELILMIPGLLCAVMAWDLCCPDTTSMKPASWLTRARHAVGALLAGVGTAALALAWLPVTADTAVLSGITAAALTAATATPRQRTAGVARTGSP